MPTSPTRRHLERCHPDDTGVDAEALTAFFDGIVARGYTLDSVMVAKAGRVLLEKWWWPAAPQTPHTLHSATKSLVGSAVGLAVAEGALTLQDKVVDLFPDALPTRVGDNLSRMTILDLLTMRSGNASGLSGATYRKSTGSLVRAFLAEPVPHEPGSVFTYSSASSHLLSVAVQRATGQRVADYLAPRLFEPLGIRSAQWDRDPEGISTGGNGLRMTTEDLLAFGMLHLADGLWHGRRVLPVGWVAEASRMHVSSADPGSWDGKRLVKPAASAEDRESGYGYQFWVAGDGSYSAQGVFGQVCLVHPAGDFVVAVTSSFSDQEHPGLVEALRTGLVPILAGDSPAGVRHDLDQWQHDAVDPPDDLPGAEPAGDVLGRYLPADDTQGVRWVEVTTDQEGVLVTAEDSRGVHSIRAAWRGWHPGRTGMYGDDLHHSYRFDDEPVLAHARWADPHTLDLRWLFPETPFRDTVELRFSGDDLVLDRRTNANSGPTRLPSLHGVRRRR